MDAVATCTVKSLELLGPQKNKQIIVISLGSSKNDTECFLSISWWTYRSSDPVVEEQGQIIIIIIIIIEVCFVF